MMTRIISIDPRADRFSITVERPIRSWTAKGVFDLEYPPPPSLIISISSPDQSASVLAQRAILVCGVSVVWLGWFVEICGEIITLAAQLPATEQETTTIWKLDYIGYQCELSLTRWPDCASFRLGFGGTASPVRIGSVAQPDGTTLNWSGVPQEALLITLHNLTHEEIAQLGAEMIAAGRELAVQVVCGAEGENNG